MRTGGTSPDANRYFRAMKVVPFLVILFLLGACNVLPRDPDGTLNMIERSGVIRVGIVADPDPIDTQRASQLIRHLESRTHAKARIVEGAAEPLIGGLENGKLDLLIGPFARDTPIKSIVALGPPLASRAIKGGRIDLVAVMRNGENRWIMLVEESSRAVASVTSKQ